MDLDPYSMMEIAQQNLEWSSKQAAQNKQFQQQGLKMQPLTGQLQQQAAEMHQKMAVLEQTKVQLNAEREEKLKQQASVTAQPGQAAQVMALIKINSNKKFGFIFCMSVVVTCGDQWRPVVTCGNLFLKIKF